MTQLTVEKIKSRANDDDLVAFLEEDSTINVLQVFDYCGIPFKESRETSDKIIRSLEISDVPKTLAFIDHLISGLELHAVLIELCKNRNVMEPLFTIDGAQKFAMTADHIVDHILIECSPEGSNQKLLEINIHKFFVIIFKLLKLKQELQIVCLHCTNL
ncbi:uncharacterized protein LOC124433670 isoform X2 [Xenia sp. Carnegie-2017]|uniref:uncharacterized protein LOC124433670 isoform X2 n=1 Tax=Xenia sp. Carnegie-2017 TaxID=2897299 RepID=UPI001F036A06|nr:uncharacterized protein LOC124433670 isoform X2 [Xenia sp. Carnegie-2017]